MKKLIKKTSIGGQALMEGILMKGPNSTAIVVRKPDGALERKYIESNGLKDKYEIFSKPFFRGIGLLYDSLKQGGKALDYSVSFLEEEEEEKPVSKFKNFFENILLTLGSILMVVGFLFIFFFLPTMISSLFKPLIDSNLGLNLIEGLIRIIFFLVYVIIIGKIKSIDRVFMYHGAEHKTIFTYEFGEELTVENVRKNPMLHPRCGTSFLFNMVIISAIVLSLFGWPNPLFRFLIRLIILPVLVGITYELNRWIGGSDSKMASILSRPGLFIQKIGTVKNPSDDMIEVAIEAMKMVIPEDENMDVWQ